EEMCENVGVRGWQLANIVLANIGCGTILDSMSSRYKRQPAGQLFLSDTTVGEQKDFVWEEPDVDLAQQFKSVLGSGVTGDQDLFGLREPKIESGGKRR